ncbi:hypothetical protein RYZ26_00685 [Terasakiella sp. A23]|uniref:hypothetical protein n=1 Tax=Terasakiella sp. FCG-A23 TaxID=3080561 RepID=UPI0029545794|nr:hypothetical protein [Terasakiella sp. A23]MDV7338090.1 hypothetical protein [Terasakiella sp. A23]
MPTSDRASREVAEHFYKKYGCARATEIISARLSGDGQVNRTEFWCDVLKQLAKMDTPRGRSAFTSTMVHTVQIPVTE